MTRTRTETMLLEALEDALVAMDTMVKRQDPTWDGKAELWSPIGKARRAIATAKGEDRT